MSVKFKTPMLHFLLRTGFFQLAHLVCRRRIRILTYHRFGERHLTSKDFERQICFLNKHFSFLDLDSLLNFLRCKNLVPPYSVVLTVDDGYKDFYTVAFPILKKYSIPATVFLTTDFIDNKIWLWHDLLNYAIDNTRKTALTFQGRTFYLVHKKGKTSFKSYIDKICTRSRIPERDTLISQLLNDLSVTIPEHPSPDYAPLSWNQIIEMSEFGISYGAHTCSHPILSMLSNHEAHEEILQSKKRIEDIMKRRISAFCYPNGKENDFNEEVKEIVKECQFECAMSTIYGMNDLHSDRYELRRIGLDGRSFTHFLYDVSGIDILRSSLRTARKKLL